LRHPFTYAPRLPGLQIGYTDRELAPGRYRIAFTGNSSIPRETVEKYLRGWAFRPRWGYSPFGLEVTITQTTPL
jgi:hypothetical protein